MNTVAEIVARTVLEYAARGIHLNAVRTSRKVLQDAGLFPALGKSLHDGKICSSLWGLRVVYDPRDVLYFGRLSPRLSEAAFLTHECRELNPDCVRPYEGADDDEFYTDDGEADGAPEED